MSSSDGPAPDPQWDFRALHAIRDAIPTRRHAEMLFDMVADLLGGAASVETWEGGTRRVLQRREEPGSPWFLPWPVLTVSRGGREGPSPLPTAIPGVYEEMERRPGPVPRLRDLGPGEVVLHDGPVSLTVNYGSDGRWFECTRGGPAETLAGAIPALAAKSAPPVELLAAFLAGLDVERNGAARVYVPATMPGGVPWTWHCGLRALRDALFRERVPRAARRVLADGRTGTAVAWGATREAAMAAWRKEVERVRPFPPKPEEPAEPPPEPSCDSWMEDNRFFMRVTMRAPQSDVPPIEPTAENTPAAMLALGDLPAEPPPLGGWVWLVGAAGNVVPAALRLEKGGFTLVGDRLLQNLDVNDLEERLAEAERREPPKPTRPPEMPPYEGPPCRFCLRTYRLVDEATGKPVPPSVSSAGWSPAFHAFDLNADSARWSAVRLRKE